MLYYKPQAVVQVNGRCSGTFVIERPVWQGCLLSPLLYVLTLARPALRGIKLTGSVRAKISVITDDITVFLSGRLDILAVKMAVERYVNVAGTHLNFEQTECLRLGSWKGSFPLPGPFRWSDGPVRILGVW